MRRFMQVSHIVFLILILAFALFELAIGAAAATVAPDGTAAAIWSGGAGLPLLSGG